MGYGRKANTFTKKAGCYKTLNRISDVAVLNRVMNLRVPEKARNFLSIRATEASEPVISVYSGCIENTWKNLRCEFPTPKQGKEFISIYVRRWFSGYIPTTC